VATENLALDTVISYENLTGATVANLDEDPDSHDANWAVATGENVYTPCVVGFPTPVGTLTDGADLQTFKVAVRKYRVADGVPQVRMEFADVFTFTWNATEITTPANVECRVYGQKSGGAPGARNACDIGAVRWIATVDAGVSDPFPAGYNRNRRFSRAYLRR
jgi:hypothetical protein